MNNYEEQIEHIMVNFNFWKVHAVMNFMGWQWGLENRTPTTIELEDTAKYLLGKVSSEDHEYYSTGGFAAYNHNGKLSLEFVIEEWDGDIE